METTLKIANWNDLKTKLKQKYPNLTDVELVYSPGKEDDLLQRLSKKLGKTQDEISRVIDDLQSKSTETSASESESSRKESSKKF